MLESIAARIDPELASLPPLPKPRTAGASLLALAASMAVAASASSLSFAAHALAESQDGRLRSIAMRVLPATLPDRLVVVAPAAIVAAILAATALLAAAGGSRSRLLLFFGLGGWLVAACVPVSELSLAMCGAAASIALIGLGPLVNELGRRSRTYREQTAARQAIGPVLSAIAIGVIAATAGISIERHMASDAATPFRLAAAACLAMTMVGFFYLVLNAIWIWSSLRRWQPLLSSVVDRPSPAGGTSNEEAPPSGPSDGPPMS